VRFENATTHVPITLPSFSAIFTSTLPPANGVHYNGSFFLDNSATTLAEILKSEGYSTNAVVAAVVLDSLNGISQGFDYYDDNLEEYIGYQPRIKLIQSQLSHTQRRAGEVTDKALDLAVSVAGKEPFFLFVHYFDPHSPYDPPPPYEMVDPLLEEGSLEQENQLYDGEVAYTDQHIGRLLKGLEEEGLLENSLLVFTSDHGENLGEHNERSHGYYVYEGTFKAPLIYSMPGKLPEGEVYSGLARHIDIVPTVLEILGIDWQDRYDLQGISLYPFDVENNADFTYIECATTSVIFGWSALRGVRSLDWKYIQAPREELYFLSEDPGELENLFDQRPEVADSLRREMENILAGLEVYQSGEEGEEMSSMSSVPEDMDFQEKLRALGYVGATKEFQSTYEDMFDSSLPDPKDKFGDFEQILASNLSMRMGMAFSAMDSMDQALSFLEQAIEQDPENEEAHFYLGLAYGKLGNYERAGHELDVALEINPDMTKASIAHVNLHLLEGDSLAALDELDMVFSSGISEEKDFMVAGRLWRHLGRMDRMLESMENVLQLNPSHVPARVSLGEHYLTTGDYEEAYSYLEPLEREIWEDDTLGVRVYYALGKCYYGRGDLDGAELLFSRMIAIDSTISGGYNHLGLISDDRGDYEEAISYYKRALSLDENRHEIHSNLGVTHYKMGSYRESKEEFEKYLRHVDEEEEAERLRAFIEHIREMERTGR
jgi:arylsulfatase A-like enzyme/Tfp pilus assembly protein PilF